MGRSWVFVLMLGCAADEEMGGGGSGGETEAAEETTAADETGAPGEELTHGFVKLQFSRSEAAPAWPGDAAQISVTMAYDSCFTEFYAANPSYQLDGADGALFFGSLADGGEGWRDRLCTPADPTQIACTVSQFEQELEVASFLTVTYAVSGSIENHLVKFGPLPLIEAIPEFECTSGLPRVLVTPTQIRGLDASGETIWQGEALDETMPAAGQGKAVVVKVAASQ